MRKRLFIFCTMMLAGLAWADAGTMVVRLKDGSVIRGKVVGASGGSLSVETQNMGIVQVQADKVASMQPEGAAGGGAAGGNAVADMQARLAADPAVLSEIMRLADDPALVRLATDPEVLQIVQSGNLQAAKDNPKVQEIMRHPAIMKLVRQIAGGSMGRGRSKR